MQYRLAILKEHGLGLKEIQETIEKIDPMPGAKEFLDELRSFSQVIILSDTFTQFASPLMKKLGMQLEGIQRSQVKDNHGKWADLYFYGMLKEDWKNACFAKD